MHEAGIEVILDVVYNHTAEGNHLGPMLSFKGIDNPAYYRLVADNRRYYMDYTGTGNTLNMRHPHVLQLIMDSLRYWVLEMHVDGFRFDLAATLARELHDVDRLSAFFDLIQQDPVVSQVKLIAEPWDIGEGGYQVGNFPPLWSEWNGKYRDTVRDFWRGTDQTLAEFALPVHRQLRSVSGHGAQAVREHQLHHRARRLHAARPRVVQREAQRGQRRRQPRRREPQPLVELRRRRADRRSRRSSRCAHGSSATSSTTLLLSQGVPMLLGGDEIGRTQRRQQQRLLPGQRDLVVRLGNGRPEPAALHAQPDPASPAPSGVLPPPLVPGPADSRHGVSDIGWFTPGGREMSEEDWQAGFAKSLGVFLNGDAIPTANERGERVVDDSFYVMFNAHHEPLDVPAAGGEMGQTMDGSPQHARVV